MQHPCAYGRYCERALKLKLVPMSHDTWHVWWDKRINPKVLALKAAKTAFHDQRNMAVARKIPWLFDFESWVAWWESQLGPDWLKKRGRCRGQYVMARKGDKGPYKAGNIRAILAHENLSERTENGTSQKGVKNGYSKLTEKQVLAIYHNIEHSYSTLARLYQVHQRHIAAIRRGEVWSHITGHKKPKRLSPPVLK